MESLPSHSAEILLARVNRELERISEAQHRLARRKALLQEQATRLRLGASPMEVRLTLEAVTADALEAARLAPESALADAKNGNGHGHYAARVL